jgi:hypothetical protein
MTVADSVTRGSGVRGTCMIPALSTRIVAPCGAL